MITKDDLERYEPQSRKFKKELNEKITNVNVKFNVATKDPKEHMKKDKQEIDIRFDVLGQETESMINDVRTSCDESIQKVFHQFRQNIQKEILPDIASIKGNGND